MFQPSSHGKPDARVRQRGELDTTDILLGIILLFLVPLMTLAVVAIFSTRSDSGARLASLSEGEILPDAEEIEARWSAAERFYSQNAKKIVQQAVDAQDAMLKEQLRKWASTVLKNARADLDGVRMLIENDKHPELASRFAAYRDKITGVQKQIDSSQAELKKIDILGRDTQ
ncbi:MAG TPA: hypothetical protein VFD71_13140 [Planctomycetota bacterium]|nr:hypothetical protein [Planctomycetota bacterium]